MSSYLLQFAIAAASPPCEAPCNGFTCGDYAALRMNCSAMLFLGCPCKGCCADGTASSAKDVESFLPPPRPCDLLEAACSSDSHHRRTLDSHASGCLDLASLVPSVNLSSFKLSVLLHQGGGMIAFVAPAFRAGGWMLGLAADALRTTSLSSRDNWIQGKTKHLFRLLFSIVVGVLLCRCCSSPGGDILGAEDRKQRDEAEGEGIKALTRGPRVAGVTLGDCRDRASSVSWEQTLAKSQRTAWDGSVEAAWRFLLWHALQPGVYLAAIYVYWGELGWWQHFFGRIVAVREVLYLAATVGIAVFQPSFLLVDVVASWKETGGPRAVVMYVLAPEKTVFGALGWSPRIKSTCWAGVIMILGGFGTVLADIFAIGALAAALHSGVTPPALMVGYGMTALAAVTVVLLAATD